MATYVNLPGVRPAKQDGGLAISVSSNAPKVLVLGTASKGFADFPYIVSRTQEAAVTFGTSGSLVRGMYETKAVGAENVILMRVGPTSCVIDGIGVSSLTGGIRVETAIKDDSAQTDYTLFWGESTQRLVITNANTDIVVYDCNTWAPLTPDVDRGEIYVSLSGAPDGLGTTIGTLSVPITLAAVGAGSYDVTYTAGTDGVSPSRMRLYELLHNAYQALENVDFDQIIPMEAFLDDSNAADMSEAELSLLSYASGAYPTTGGASDALLYFYTEEYQGENLFWWRRNGTIDEESVIFSFEDAYTTADGDMLWFENLAGTTSHAIHCAIPLHGFVETSPGPIDLSSSGEPANWGTTSKALDIDIDGGTGPNAITLDADCTTTTEIVALINTKIAAIPALVADVAAYRVDESKIGIRRLDGGAGQDLEILAGTGWAALGIAVGSYTGAASTTPSGTIFSACTTVGAAGAALTVTASAIDVATAFYNAAVTLAISGISWTDNGDGTVTMAYDDAGYPTDAEVYDATEATDGTITVGHVVKNEPDVYPTGYATTTPAGVDLTATNFHEVNFAYQLASFCHVNSENNTECIGFVGVKPPVGASLRDVQQWIGSLPTYTADANGDLSITSELNNGTGLLGNKFMAGRYDFRAGAEGGGFIATDTGFMDGVALEDLGGHLVDIGKYINVIGAWANVYNGYDTTGLGYNTTGATSYAAMVSTLEAKSAPTNKRLPRVALPWRISNTKLDQLAGVKYVMLQEKPKGVVVSDAPTAARNDSDYRRLTTVRIVKDVVDAIRTVSDPFIGEAGGAPQRAALKTACESALAKMQKAGYLQRFDLSITATPAQSVAGQATIELVIVPAFELRQITLVISLAAQ